MNTYICQVNNNEKVEIMKNVTSLTEQTAQTRHGFSDTHKVVEVLYVDDKGRNTIDWLDLRIESDIQLYSCYKFILKMKIKKQLNK